MRRSEVLAQVQDLSTALNQWQSAIGVEHVVTNRDELMQYQRNCAAPGQFALAVLRPGSMVELREVVKIANTHRVALFPISSGKNWGYGSRSPARDGNVIVELKRLNRILEVNVPLAYAVIEPGVTQQQLFEYLENNNLPLMMDATGASPHASIIGNLCERGSGLSPYSDHFNHACGFEVLLADGRVLNTGFSHLSPHKAGHVYRWGVGPFLDGLFTQSNYGLITKATVWLMPKPKAQAAVLIKFRDDAQFAKCIGRLRDLKLHGVLSGAVHVANDLRVLSSMTSYPFEECAGKTPLPDAVRLRMQRLYGVASWNLIGGIWGSHRQIRASIYEIRKALKGEAGVVVVSELAVSVLSKFGRLYRIFGGVGLEQKLSILRLLKGVPSYAPLRGAYWRKHRVPKLSEADPDRDGCGLIWFSPIVPLLEAEISQVLNIIRSTCALWGFETNLTVSLINERAAVCPVAIVFDADNVEEASRAKACHEQLIDACVQAGYPPYRFGTSRSAYEKSIYGESDVFWEVCRELKMQLDPNGIIAPGRYVD